LAKDLPAQPAGGGLAHFDVNMIHAGQIFQNALGFRFDLLRGFGIGEVSCIVTLTAPLAAEISLTRPKETMSREKPGYLTAFSAFWICSCDKHGGQVASFMPKTSAKFIQTEFVFAAVFNCAKTGGMEISGLILIRMILNMTQKANNGTELLVEKFRSSKPARPSPNGCSRCARPAWPALPNWVFRRCSDEDWRFTNVAPIAKLNFHSRPKPPSTARKARPSTNPFSPGCPATGSCS
jgi:hypothetical protein